MIRSGTASAYTRERASARRHAQRQKGQASSVGRLGAAR